MTLAMDMTRGVYTNLRIPCESIVNNFIANWESAINPPEVFRLDLKSKTQNRSPLSTPSKSRRSTGNRCVTSGSRVKQANAFTT